MKKLMIGVFEGMDHSLMLDWADAGLLPNFRRMLNEGRIESMQGGRVPYEVVNLYSAFSGISDEEHGILSFWKAHNHNYIPQLWDSSDFKDQMFWKHEPFQHLRYQIINVFGTFPVYDIHGYIISYCIHNSIRVSHPTRLMRDLHQKGLSYYQDTAAWYSKRETDPNIHVDRVHKVEKARFSVFKELLKDDLDISIVNFTTADRMGHSFFNELMEKNKAVTNTKMYQGYQECDNILGELMALTERDPQTELLVMSEIGFGPLNKFVNINNYLAEKNLLQYDNSSGMPDWSRTIAFESVQGSHGVNINLSGRNAQGTVSESEYEATVRELKEILKRMENEETGDPMFADVIINKDFTKDYEKVPDLVLIPYDERYLPYGDPYYSKYTHRHVQTGWHRTDGFWGGFGPQLGHCSVKQEYRLIDIVPTIYDLYQFPIPGHLKGVSFLSD